MHVHIQDFKTLSAVLEMLSQTHYALHQCLSYMKCIPHTCCGSRRTRSHATGTRAAAATALTSSSTSCRPWNRKGRTVGRILSVMSYRKSMINSLFLLCISVAFDHKKKDSINIISAETFYNKHFLIWNHLIC